jgi:hypothetical protein
MKVAWTRCAVVLVTLTGVALGSPLGWTPGTSPKPPTKSGDTSWEAHRGDDVCSPAVLPKPTLVSDARDRHKNAPADMPAPEGVRSPEQLAQAACHAPPPIRTAGNCERTHLCQWLI